MNGKNISTFIIVALLALPSLAHGQTIMQNFNDMIINPLIILLLVSAVVYFLFGVMLFVKNQDSEDAQVEGKRHMVWGIVGIAVIISVFGILNLLNDFVLGITT